MRAALVATFALVGCCAISAPAFAACDRDAIRHRVQPGTYRVTAIEASDGIVTFVLSAPSGASAVALAVHATGTRLFTSAIGAELDETAMGEFRELPGRWNADPEMQALLCDCGVGFGGAAADLDAVLRRAAEMALARHGRVLRHVVTGWSIAIAALMATAAMAAADRRWRWHRLAALTAIVALLPLGWMVFRTVGFDWYPTGDHAIIELGTHDVGTSETPLLGPYSGRAGWHHPGPMMFYAYALPYRLTGGASWTQLAAAGLCNVLATATALAMAWRAGGFGLTCSLSLGLAVLVANLGATCVDSWNASVAILPFGAAILAAWAAANGDRVALMVTIVAGSFAAQAHLAFAGPVATLWSVVLLKAVRLPGGRRATMAALGVLIACWAPVVYDQLFASGNVGALVRYFSRGHQPIGWRAALGIAERQLSLTAPWLGFPEPSSEVTGLLPSRPMLLLVPVGAFLGSALAAYRRHARDAVALQVVIAIAMAASLGATARISDAALSYQVRFWWVIAMCWWVSILWSCLSCAPASRLKASLSLALCCAVMAVSLTTLTSAESMLPGNDARMLAIAEATIPVTAGHPLVLVRSLDSEAMSLTTGLILQLEKHGIRVNVSTLDERALGDRRLVTSTAGALVILVAAGDSLDRLRRQAEQQMSQPGELRLVTSYGTHPRTLAAVFSYRVAAS